MYNYLIGQIRGMLHNLQAVKKLIRGDGFGRAGDLKSAFKKSIRRLEELQVLLEAGPIDELVQGDDANPNCLGHGADNVPSCECRLILKNVVQ